MVTKGRVRGLFSCSELELSGSMEGFVAKNLVPLPQALSSVSVNLISFQQTPLPHFSLEDWRESLHQDAEIKKVLPFLQRNNRHLPCTVLSSSEASLLLWE